MNTQRLILFLATALTVMSPLASAQRSERRLEWSEKKERQAVVTRCLTWLTGGSEENDYVSVGRLANQFGFVYFRVNSGHTVNRAGLGQETLDLLGTSAAERLLALNEAQLSQLERVRRRRVEMNRLLEGLLDGDQREEEELVALGEAFGLEESRLALLIGREFAALHANLTDEQLRSLRELRARWEGGGGSTSGARGARDSVGLSRLSQEEKQEFWNLVTRFLTWVTGTPEANDFDTPGKPSQHFGFVSLRVESGHAVSRAGVAEAVQEVLDEEQERVLHDAAARNREDFEVFFQARARLNRELERGLAGELVRASEVEEAGRQQGRAEARMTWRQAEAFLEVRELLDSEQVLALIELRQRYLDLPTPEEVERDPLAAGRRLFVTCALCHVPQQEGRALGPSLDGVVGRAIASIEGFRYSEAMKRRAANGARWTPESLSRFLRDPRQEVPGTAMGFAGLPDPALREALVQFLGARQESSAAPSTVEETTLRSSSQERERAPTKATRRRPNFVVILSDDQGWDGLSVEMEPGNPASASDVIETPHIARLAGEGMRFTRGYSPAPVCSPTRASLQTGLDPARLRWTKAAPSVDAEDGYALVTPISRRDLGSEVTIAEVLGAAGYATAHLGKWHIGGGGPEAHGYELSDGDTGNQDAIPFGPPNPVDIFGMTERALDFVRASREEQRPFFLQLSYHALHHAENALPETIEKYRRLLPRGKEKEIQRAALAENLDTAVGRLLSGLDELSLADSTYVVYLSDNGSGGAGGRRKGLRGGKGGLWEGGIRVPFLVRGPGVPAGAHSDVTVAGQDLLPTLAELAGVEDGLPAVLDGGSFAGQLRGSKEPVERREPGLLFHFPHYQGQETPQSALLLDGWKLIEFYETGTVELYDLERDPSESRDLAASEPERAGAMTVELRRRLADRDAVLPGPQSRSAEGARKRREKGGGKRGRKEQREGR